MNFNLNRNFRTEINESFSKDSTIFMRKSFLFLSAFFALLSLAPIVFAQTSPSSSAQTSGLKQIDVFESGKDGYFAYRIPSIVLTPKGTLVAIAEGRKNSRSDTGDIDLVMKRSFDGGNTWSEMKVIGDNGENTFGNPTQVVDRKTGTIWLFSTHNPGKVHESNISEGAGEGGRTVWVLKSTDDGATWSTPIEITSSVKEKNWGWYATGPGNGIQLKSGRLVIPANHSVIGKRNSRSHVFYSDDAGATWKLGGIAGEGTNESQVVERADGTLLLNMRNHRQHPQIYVRAIVSSKDGGKTWSKITHDPMLLEPICQASIIRHDGKDQKGVLLFSNPASLKREKLTVRASFDGGNTWTLARQINAKGSAYSNLVSLPNDEIGDLYEYSDQQPYQKIIFAKFSLDWLKEKETATSTDMRPVVAPKQN
jgi:sialidase-1